MKNSAYRKSIVREIVSSKARFASILAIIFLGVAFYSGIKSSGPDMKASISNFYNSQNLMDSKIVSSIGLTDKDLDLLKNNDKILDYYGTHSIDVNLISKNSVVKFMEYNPNNSNTINIPTIVDGRLPENSGEIALDEKVLNSDDNLKIGDTYIVEADEDTIDYFKETTFKIVGFVKSPMYIEKESRGTTSVGKGSIDYFGVINSSDISMDVYTEIYVRFKNVQGINGYSDDYKDKMEENNEYLEGLFSNRVVERIEEIKSDAQVELDKGYKEIEDGEAKLLDAQKEIDDGKEKLQDGQKQYEQGLKDYEQKIKDGETKLKDGQKQLQEGQAELDKQKQKLVDGENQLNQAKVQIDKAKDEFVKQGIDPDKGTSEYESQIASLNTLNSSYVSLSNDIRGTTSTIKEGEEIPKAMISNPSLGLQDLNPLLSGLEISPSNVSLATNIANGVDTASKTLGENITKLETLVSGIKQYQQGKSQYETQLKVLNDGKLQIQEAQKKIDNSKIELAKGQKELEDGKKQGISELNKANKELEEAEIKLADGEKEINENKQKLIDARAEIQEEQDKLKDLDKSKYYFFDRSDNPGYGGFRDAIKSIDNIAKVFPVFFFLLAVLICLTTMTRMVEENRVEIGTLKALGYSDLEISRKFVVYAALASVFGSILGILLGSNVFPYVIHNAYGMLFSLPTLKIYYYPAYIIQSLAASIICTVGASLFVLKVELQENPSNLMKAKAPKLGKKIFLERITILWKRLNFNQKVTLRNIFRYKQRMIMTVFGIAGCMAMLVTGFALLNANNIVLDKQFDNIWKYQAIVIFNDDYNKEDSNEYDKALNQIEGYQNSINIHQQSVTFSKEGMNKQTVSMYVPEHAENLNEFLSLHDRTTKEEYKLSDNGAIINEKLAKLLKASVGDMVTLKDEDNNSYTVKVDKIAENYFAHFIYMSPAYYEQIFGEKPVYNAQFLSLDSSEEKEDEISTELMDCKKVINVTLTSTISDASKDSASKLNLVMLVIIISSGSLAFIVLYNLTNINVSERIRELSTIKVLGFFDNEVTMYILRENVILTLLGVLAGSFMGRMLYLFIINTAETDNMMMFPDVYMSSYIYSGLITLVFSLLVMIMMHIKLKSVNMIDALKSVE